MGASSSSNVGANTEMALQIVNLIKVVTLLLDKQNSPKVESCAYYGETYHNSSSFFYGIGSGNVAKEVNYIGQYGQRLQGGNFQGRYNNNWWNLNVFHG